MRSNALEVIISQVAQRDTARALELAASIPAGGPRNQILANLADNLVFANPRAAVDIAMTLPRGESRADTLRNALYQWVRNSPAEAIAFAEQGIPTGEERDNRPARRRASVGR